MTIHNLMEDFVYNEVNKVFDAAKEKNEPWFTCNCMQCRLDTVCFVLNRIKPRYTASGRGMAHFLSLAQSVPIRHPSKFCLPVMYLIFLPLRDVS